MIRHLSCEFVLRRMPNGGTAVLIRSSIISLFLYLIAIALKSRIAPGATWHFDSAAFRMLIAETIPWFGAIFAGVYVALYSRFASQWNYLASLYNQIMQTAVANPPNGISHESALRLWQAGFIEDAEGLHLAGKPMFASVIRSMLTKPETRSYFIAHSPGGAERLAKLELRVAKALESSIRHQGLEVTDQTMPSPAPTAPGAMPQPAGEVP
jgi:hypothetical protein